MTNIDNNTIKYFELYVNDKLEYKELKEAICNEEIDVRFFENLLEGYNFSNKQKKMLGKMALIVAGSQAAKYAAGYPGLGAYYGAYYLFKHMKKNRDIKIAKRKLDTLNPRRNFK